MAVADQVGLAGAVDAPFAWIPFYEAVGRALLAFRNDRPRLLQGLFEIQRGTANLDYLTRDQFADGRTGPLEDIDPFTVMATFNRPQRYEQRTVIAGRLAHMLHVELTAPITFGGIPTVDARSSWFFSFSKDRGAHDIDQLWTLFERAALLADASNDAARAAFADAYDTAARLRGMKWKQTFGLFWAHPHVFASLSSKAQEYLRTAVGVEVGTHGLDAAAYLDLIDRLRAYFTRSDARVRSFPEIALAAWQQEQVASGGARVPPRGVRPDDPDPAGGAASPAIPLTPGSYSLQTIVDEGCFLPDDALEIALARLHEKQNLILRGPPGTGKTWLARRLAYACVGSRDETRVLVVQFHANSSYEDMVCGFRPDARGALVVADGPILQAIERARSVPGRPFVLVIEEFNRGNPAQIFGELLTLLEADKRRQDAAVRLMYPDSSGRPRELYLPPNFHLIGTMNVADRSLAVLDRALRRRFAFIDLGPALNERWRRYVAERGIPAERAADIAARLGRLNDEIAGDASLGPQCRVGHSFVTPRQCIDDVDGWFARVVETEIRPLLDDYWFDQPKRAQAARAALLEGWPHA